MFQGQVYVSGGCASMRSNCAFRRCEGHTFASPTPLCALGVWIVICCHFLWFRLQFFVCCLWGLSFGYGEEIGFLHYISPVFVNNVYFPKDVATSRLAIICRDVSAAELLGFSHMRLFARSPYSALLFVFVDGVVFRLSSYISLHGASFSFPGSRPGSPTCPISRSTRRLRRRYLPVRRFSASTSRDAYNALARMAPQSE